MRRPLQVAVILVLLTRALVVHGEAGGEIMRTPAHVWRGIDPEASPLEVQPIKTWEEEGCRFEKLTFVTEVVDGTKIRVYAIYGAPNDSKNLPGVVHIHGGGQTATLGWVKFWAKRGYACVSFDYWGKYENRTNYTDWGPLTTNMEIAFKGIYQVHPTPRSCAWFHWALAARRALTLLAQEPKVAPDKLGIFGISMGGTLTWMVAGADARVKAAVAIYGCGYNADPRKSIYGLVPTEDQMIFKDTLSPEAHAPYIKCPLLFLSASNDHHGWMDDSFDALGAVEAPTRQAFTPYYVHHIDPEQGVDLPAWMNWHLKGGAPFPATPGLETRLDQIGVLEGCVRPAEATTVSNVAVYYALGMKIPPSRYWRRVQATRGDDNVWRALLPTINAWDRVSIFANVLYNSGVCLSSKLSQVAPGRLGKARATLSPSVDIDDGSDSPERWIYWPAYTDPNINATLLRSGNDGERRYISVNPENFGKTIDFGIASHIFGDPQFQAPANASLAFDCKGGFNTNGLTLTFAEHEWLPSAAVYKATLSQKEVTGDWKTIVVHLTRFVNDKGSSPASWYTIDRLQISGTTDRSAPPLFSRFHWVGP